MAYSSYGSYNWERVNGEWVFRPEFEDRTLVTGQVERNLEAVFGLKFDAILQGQENEENERFKDLPFEVKGLHHSVIGDLEGFAVVSRKGYPSVLWKGKVVDTIEYNDVYGGKEFDYALLPHPKVIDRKEGDCKAKVMIDTQDNWYSVAYVKNNDKEYLSFCGYGIGDHYFLDEEGYRLDNDGNRDYSEKPIMRKKECLKRALWLLEIK